MGTDVDRAPDFVVVVPVKPMAVAKSRLADLGDAARRQLAEAFVQDTVAAATAASRVRAVLVVTDDHQLAGRLRHLGCVFLPDGVSGDLNETLRLAAAEVVRRWPGSRPVALCADLPALTPEVLDEGLGLVAGHPVAFVADTAGTGTTLYSATPPDFAPRFGVDSARAHREGRAVEVAGVDPRLRADVDSPADLGRVLALEVGPATARASGRA